jgi:hypothetical protein
MGIGCPKVGFLGVRAIVTGIVEEWDWQKVHCNFLMFIFIGVNLVVIRSVALLL